MIKLMTNLYEGWCIFPSPENLQEMLFEAIGVEGATVSDEGESFFNFSLYNVVKQLQSNRVEARATH